MGRVRRAARPIAAIRQARELGVNLFDTAQGYGFGASEQLLGRALRDDLDNRRDEVVIATKGGLRMTDDGLVRDASPELLRAGVEDSLRALEVDYVDIYQVHWPDPDVPFAETAARSRSSSRRERSGTSASPTTTRPRWPSSRAPGRWRHSSRPTTCSAATSRRSVLPYAREHDIGVLVYGPLAHGLLTGSHGRAHDLRRRRLAQREPRVPGRDLPAQPGDRRASWSASPPMSSGSRSPSWRSRGRWPIRPSTSPSSARAARGTSRRAIAAAELRLSEADLAQIDRIVADSVAIAGPFPEMGRLSTETSVFTEAKVS